MVAGTIYMMRDISVIGFHTVSLVNLFVILGTWLMLNFTRLPSPVIVFICLLLGWAF
jgi:chromate transporter